MGKILTEKYGKKLVDDGKANEAGFIYHNDKRYMAITRYDPQRTDHYECFIKENK